VRFSNAHQPLLTHVFRFAHNQNKPNMNMSLIVQSSLIHSEHPFITDPMPKKNQKVFTCFGKTCIWIKIARKYNIFKINKKRPEFRLVQFNILARNR